MKSIIALFAFIFCLQPIYGQLAKGYAVLPDRSVNLFNQNPIEAQLFKPEEVMKHQRALNLTQSQKDAILGDYQKAQSDFTKWQWELQAATEELVELVSKDQIDEKASLEQLEKMLDLERNIKSSKLGLMIKIKNQLTPEQQKKLRDLSHPRFWDGQSQYFDAFKLLQEKKGLFPGRQED